MLSDLPCFLLVEKAPSQKLQRKDYYDISKDKVSQASKAEHYEVGNQTKRDRISCLLMQVAQVMELTYSQRFLMSNNKLDLVQIKELVTNQRFPMYPNTDQRVKKNPGHSVKERKKKKMMMSITMMKTMMSMTVMMIMRDEGDDFVHPNLSTYIADDQEKEKEEEKADDDDDDVTFDQKVSTPPDYELAEEDENQ
ncbi:hypothetical protein Tco_1492229 [Tanacetum coccineum]